MVQFADTIDGFHEVNIVKILSQDGFGSVFQLGSFFSTLPFQDAGPAFRDDLSLRDPPYLPPWKFVQSKTLLFNSFHSLPSLECLPV